MTTLFFANNSFAAGKARLKELVDVQGMRTNAIYGYGIVTGLSGSGDTESSFTTQSITAMLARLGIRLDPQQVRTRNMAAVMVTADLPTFSRSGSRIDVQVSAMGNARSLTGGVLLPTQLIGGDGQVYAVAQGAVQIGGVDATSSGTSIQRNEVNVGRVPGGGTVERSVVPSFDDGPVALFLRKPDFTTAQRITDAINASLGTVAARAVDPGTIEVDVPGMPAAGAAGAAGAGGVGAAAGGGAAPAPAANNNAKSTAIVALIQKLEAIEVEPDGRAIIVISERSGTIVAGSQVRIRPVAIAHGNLEVAITQRPAISQPGAFAGGGTVVVPQADVSISEQTKPVIALPATTTISELATALNQLGVSTRDLISILQAMKAAGAIDAEIQSI